MKKKLQMRDRKRAAMLNRIRTHRARYLNFLATVIAPKDQTNLSERLPRLQKWRKRWQTRAATKVARALTGPAPSTQRYRMAPRGETLPAGKSLVMIGASPVMMALQLMGATVRRPPPVVTMLSAPT